MSILIKNIYSNVQKGDVENVKFSPIFTPIAPIISLYQRRYRGVVIRRDSTNLRRKRRGKNIFHCVAIVRDSSPTRRRHPNARRKLRWLASKMRPVGSSRHLVCIFVSRHYSGRSLKSCTQLRRSVTSNTKSTGSRTLGLKYLPLLSSSRHFASRRSTIRNRPES